MHYVQPRNSIVQPDDSTKVGQKLMIDLTSLKGEAGHNYQHR